MKALVALALALIFTLPAAALGAASTLERKASLRLATAQPVALKGSRFLGDERVVVVVVSGERMRSRTVTAGDAGTFVIRFTGMRLDRCDGLVAVAHGARGSSAVYRLPAAMCRM